MINARHTNNIPFPCNAGTAIDVRKSPNPTEAPAIPISRQDDTKNTVVKLIFLTVPSLPIPIPGKNTSTDITMNPYAAGRPVILVEQRYTRRIRTRIIPLFSLPVI